jgi:AraC-like DNA-binding protein
LDYDAIFDGRKARIQLYYAEHPDGCFASVQPMLLPGEGFVVAGGVGVERQADSLTSSNFVTSREVWLLRTEPRPKAAFPWGWAALPLAAVLALVAVYVFRRKKPESVPPASAETEEGTNRSDLLGQMVSLIEEKELWKRADLRLDDIARELASNRMYISTLLNSISGVNFTTLINGYRIKHAQQLMREHPDMLIDTVAEESGFSSRTAFFRNFKAQTGMTPKQWLSQAEDENV